MKECVAYKKNRVVFFCFSQIHLEGNSEKKTK